MSAPAAPRQDPDDRTAAPGRGLPLLVLPAAAFVTVTAEALPVGLLRQMADGLGTSAAQIGLLVAWFAVVAGTTPVLLTRVTRRLDRRTVAVGMLVLFAVACAVTAAAPSFAVVLPPARCWRWRTRCCSRSACSCSCGWHHRAAAAPLPAP